MYCSMPGFPVLHHLLGLAQTHVHWVSDAILPSHPVAPFSSYSQSSPASGYFLMSRLFTSGSQSIGAPASVFLMNTQCWFPLGISLQSQRLSRAFSNTTVQKHQFFSSQLSLWSNSHIHKWLLEKPWLWLYGLYAFIGKVMSLLFNTLSRFVLAFFQGARVF